MSITKLTQLAVKENGVFENAAAYSIPQAMIMKEGTFEDYEDSLTVILPYDIFKMTGTESWENICIAFGEGDTTTGTSLLNRLVRAFTKGAQILFKYETNTDVLLLEATTPKIEIGTGTLTITLACMKETDLRTIVLNIDTVDYSNSTCEVSLEIVSELELPTKLSELENDCGYFSLSDSEDAPFEFADSYAAGEGLILEGTEFSVNFDKVASPTQVDEKIAAVEVGVVNLLNQIDNGWTASYGSISNGVATAVTPVGSVERYVYSPYFEMIGGETYTLSFYAKLDVTSKACNLYMLGNDTSITQKIADPIYSQEWGRYTYTFQAKAEFTADVASRLRFDCDTDGSIELTLSIKDVALVRGNLAPATPPLSKAEQGYLTPTTQTESTVTLVAGTMNSWVSGTIGSLALTIPSLGQNESIVCEFMSSSATHSFIHSAASMQISGEFAEGVRSRVVFEQGLSSSGSSMLYITIGQYIPA